MRVIHSNHTVPFYKDKTETLCLNNHLHNDTAPISEELTLIELSPLLGSFVRLKCVLI